MFKTRSVFEGYEWIIINFGMGSPGYKYELRRGGVLLKAGPYTDGEEYRHPEWAALPVEERRRVMAGVKTAESRAA